GAPLPETLKQMPSQAILSALNTGKMKAIGDQLTSGQREAIAKFLGIAESQSTSSAKCDATTPRKSNGDWNGWSDAANTRFQPAAAAGLTRETTPKLKLKWAFGFPGVTTAFGAPAVVDGRVFVGAGDGTVYALNAATGCTYWSFAAAAGVRVAPAIGA